jgi:hypothetical protein
LETNKPKRGRKRTPDSISRRLDKIDAELATSDPVKRLGLVQEQMDLQAELTALQGHDDLAGLEEQFVAHAKAYGESKRISYAAWRSIGVPAEVLRAAGISRSAG